ncbi:MAG TPA: serine--tRNA ligase [Planctomycetes bacterium]|nr:serine--tRNA ligase [Planctomycetota bacterium]
MLDLKFIRQHPDVIKDGARKKHIPCDVDRILELDRRIRAIKTEAEAKKAEQKRRSKEIPGLDGEEKARALQDLKRLGDEQKAMDAEIRVLDEELQKLLFEVPNPPAPEVPEGKDDAENVELRRHGEPVQFPFEAKDHLELGRMHDLFDFERAARIAGSRTYFLKNAGALLELGVLRLALDHMVSKGFTPMLVPHLVRYEAMAGTAYFPGGEEQAYCTEKDELYLIGTAEVPLTSYRRGEILDAAELPLRMVGWSNCYRREAGAAGRDTRGLYRIHQFQKIEQVIVCENDEAKSVEFHDQILRNSEEVLQMLELPYRVVDVCGGDLGRGQIRKFDIETWMPSRNSYSETHSASRFHDFQARRLNLRYRDADGKVHICHTLNNTVIASPRVLIPLLENHQQADGSIRIPKALRPYMGGKEVLEPRA